MTTPFLFTRSACPQYDTRSYTSLAYAVEQHPVSSHKGKNLVISLFCSIVVASRAILSGIPAYVMLMI